MRPVIAAAVLVSAAAAPAAEAPEGEMAFGGQRKLGVAMNVGFYKSMGLGVRVGHPRWGVELSGGWSPLLIAWANPGEVPGIRFVGGYQLDLDLSVFVAEVGPQASVAATPGYRFNTELGHGIGVGGYAELSFSAGFALRAILGLQIYPSGDDRIRGRDDVPDDAEFGFPGPQLQGGIGLALLLYP
jgi:hypothetical protein